MTVADLSYGIVRVIQVPVGKNLNEAKCIVITWRFLPELCNLEKEILELDRYFYKNIDKDKK